MPTTHEITNLLIAWSDGDRESLDQLAPLVESELHRLARGHSGEGTSRPSNGEYSKAEALYRRALAILQAGEDQSERS